MSKTIKILTPDNVEIEYSLASVGVRAAAAGIDLLLQGVVVLISGLIAWAVLYYTEASEESIYLIIAILTIIFALLNYAYYIVCDLLMKGQTFGKKVYHIRVIRENGEGITLAHAMIREFIRSTLDPIGVGFILIFFSKRNKRLGDMAASTIVVEEQRISLSYLDLIYNPIGQYDLTKEESSLLQDYFTRKNVMEIQASINLRNQLVRYFNKRFELHGEETEGDFFLKSLME